MQEEALVSQKLVCDILQRSGKETWEFPIRKYSLKKSYFSLTKKCKLAYQRKKLDKEKKKAVKDTDEKDLKRTLKTGEIQEVKKTTKLS